MPELVTTGTFAGWGIDELLAWRKRLQLRLLNGAPTRVAIAGGMTDEFLGKTDRELRELLSEINGALRQADPDNYADNRKRMVVTQVVQGE